MSAKGAASRRVAANKEELNEMTPKPPPYKPPTRGLRELTFFLPPDRLAIYRLSGSGFQLLRMLRGARVKRCRNTAGEAVELG